MVDGPEKPASSNKFYRQIQRPFGSGVPMF